ncbi:MAG: DUF1553 domain-containing protein [Planctomycetaceae bacterium]|nr:DUF1553 domain-containing protein [Planctomycetaceae bacterium]
MEAIDCRLGPPFRTDAGRMKSRHWRRLERFVIVSWAIANAWGVSRAGAAAPPVRFNRDIRPILSEQCLACHGPDARSRQASLRLDVEHNAKAELASGARPIVAGRIDQSELIARITAHDPTERMPPPEAGPALSANQVERLKQWIAEGAVWENHWSLEPIGRPIPPAAGDGEPLRNPIDAFVQAKRREHALSPAFEADRATLLRRASLDLVGLPPSWSQIADFLDDPAPDAYERAVDRLLASPHFGERMAIGWLDAVRYADSCGYFADRPVPVSPYRDYVIGAFNTNLPFNRFTTEQLAGDLLPDATDDQHVAAAYNRLGRMSNEGGVQEQEYLSRSLAERVRNVGSTWLGLTLGCCECHDHKYDPLPARDFYRLGAFFADIKERGVYDKMTNAGVDWGPVLRRGTPAQLAEFTRLDSEIDGLKRELEQLQARYREPTGDLAQQLSAWEAGLKNSYKWARLDRPSVVSREGGVCKVLPDASVLVAGPRAKADRYVLRAKAPLKRFTAVRLEVLPDPSLPGLGPGRADDGNFVLTGFKVRVGGSGDSSSRPVRFRGATATFEQTDAPGDIVSRVWSAAAAIEPDRRLPESGWAVTDQTGIAQEAIFETATDVVCNAGDELTIELDHGHGRGHTLGRFRLSVADTPRPIEVYRQRLPAQLCRIVNLPTERQSNDDRRDLADYYAVHQTPAGRELQEQIDTRSAALRRLNEQLEVVLAVETIEPRPIRVLNRGNWQDERGELVEPGVPESLPALEALSGRPTRLDLARWLVSRGNPLTARVLVNRLWKLYFGAALSRNVDDLGSQGAWPTHPELLDWLAGRLIDSGWDVKHVIRLIVTSATYRQSSIASAEARERDPENRWLSHQSQFRLEAELIRDNALAVSGLLAARIGGKSVRPYQPDNYWMHMKEVDRLPRVWIESRDENLYRRGLYTHWQRQFLHPMLLAFDAPSRDECAADRPRSNTPMQALTLLNDPTFVEAARALAQRALQQSGVTADERLGWLYREVLSRPPQPAEQAVLENLLERHAAIYQADPHAALELLSIGRHPLPAATSVVELAVWISVARVVLNLHDVVVRK